MTPSLYDELAERLRKDPRLTRRGGGPRVDLGLLLSGEHEAIARLWKAADRAQRREPGADADLREAVERLRPIFGEREGERA